MGCRQWRNQDPVMGSYFFCFIPICHNVNITCKINGLHSITSAPGYAIENRPIRLAVFFYKLDTRDQWRPKRYGR